MIRTGMQRLFNIMTLWLLSIAAFCSCSPAYLDGGDTAEDLTLIIAGTVSETAGSKPVEGVKIRFQAYGPKGLSDSPVMTQNAYTDSQGVFSIKAEGFSSAVTCVLVTEHPDYSSVRKDILINWKGTSYDIQTRTFFVNDCNFVVDKL